MSTYNSKTVKTLKSNAKGQLIGRYSQAILATLIVSAIQLFVMSLADSAYTGSINSYLIRLAISVIIDLLSGILIYGQTRYFLLLVRGEEPLRISEVFYGFKNNMDKAVLIQAVYTVVTLVTSIPIILASVGIWAIPDRQYILLSASAITLEAVLIFIEKLFIGLSFYILDDNPDMSVPDIFKRSLELMEHKKGRYFVICLSMIPLFILGFLGLFIGSLWVSVYLETTLANFYLDCIGEEPKSAISEEAGATSTNENSTSEIH